MTSKLSVAVIGAGVAGLTCARRLHDAGLDVVVFDKARGPSGRMSTRRTETGIAFDHGAQYFTARSPAFANEVAAWARAGCVDAWAGRFGDLRRGLFIPQSPRRVRWVGRPRMSAIARHLATGLDLRTGCSVGAIDRPSAAGASPRGSWRLTDNDGRKLGTYDDVVVAVPAPQAAPLLAPSPELAGVAATATLESCLALMIVFEHRLDLPFDAARSTTGPFSWLARDSSKPGRSGQETWVAHASPGWSAAHLELETAERTSALLAAFAETTGVSQQPVALTSHRWRYARVVTPAAAPGGLPFLYDASARLGACGDWLVGPRVEAAWCSGAALSDRLLNGADGVLLADGRTSTPRLSPRRHAI